MSALASRPDNAFVSEFLDDFFAECDEHLVAVRRDLLALEAAQGQPHAERAPANELLRRFHTLKGLAGMVGVPGVEQLAHLIESFLRGLGQREVSLSAEALSALSAGTRTIEQILANNRAQRPEPDIGALAARIAALIPARRPESVPVEQAASTPQTAQDSEDRAQIDAAIRSGTPLWQVVFTPTPQLAERNLNVNFIRGRLMLLGEIVRAVPLVQQPGKIAFEFLLAAELDPAALEALREDGISYARYTPPEPESRRPWSSPSTTLRGASGTLERPAPEPAGATSPVLTPSNVVRVDLARIDSVIRIVGDLVISRARLGQELAPLESDVPVPAWRALQETTTALERQLRQLRQGVMQMRLVPIGEAFARMQFVIHDIARQSGKQVALDLHGEATEIDKFVVERMLDPLLHLVRNAVGHGLEPPDERVARGKPPAGRIALRAATAGDLVLIAIEDDGRGIDAQHVAERARALGMLGAGEPLDPAMLLDVICAPGFSTREQADRVSGRGVGMEVVKRTVQELGGVLSLDTAAGRGTRFSIQLPLTLAIVDALIVAVADHVFAMPMPSLREVVELEPDRLSKLENNELLSYRGGALPLLRLARHFGLAQPSVAREYALVVGGGPGAAGIVVDRIAGKREIVVRALADPLVQQDGLAGATELGDGRPILILDALALAHARRPRARAALAGTVARAGEQAESSDHNGSERAMAETQPITDTFVLCELAGAIYAIPSRLVRQIDLVEQITPVPNAPPFVAGITFSRGQVIPAIDLRARFGFERIAYTLRSRLVVISTGERTVGLVVDTAREFVTISAEAIQAPPEAIAGLSGAYLHGIARVGERLVLVLDMHEVLRGAETIAAAPEA